LFAQKVVLLALEVLAELSSAAGTSGPASAAVESADAAGDEAVKFFERLIVDLQALFRADRALLDVRGPFIIRQLCLLMNPEKIFRAMAGLGILSGHGHGF
jgi:vacuole morphology and inheritance protein 14